jgi:hypothetical protein
MHEICQSGSEGGAKTTFVPTPISAQGFNPGNRHPERRALKGRQIERTKHTKARYNCNNVSIARSSRPFRANRLF